MGLEITTEIINAIRSLGKAKIKFFAIDCEGLKLITIYLSKLNIIRLQKIAPSIMKIGLSNIKERAKKEEINAKIEVKKIVTPIVEYFMISYLGHWIIMSLLTPEQNKKNLDTKLVNNIYNLLNYYKIILFSENH